MSVTASQYSAMSATRWKVIVLSHENRASPCQWPFNWLISGHQSVNLSREAISALSGKYKRFTFVHPVLMASIIIEMMSFYFRKHS